jgi:hypothetical protein
MEYHLLLVKLYIVCIFITQSILNCLSLQVLWSILSNSYGVQQQGKKKWGHDLVKRCHERERLYDKKRLTCSSNKDRMKVVLMPIVEATIWGCEVLRCSSWSGMRRWKLGSRSPCRDMGWRWESGAGDDRAGGAAEGRQADQLRVRKAVGCRRVGQKGTTALTLAARGYAKT